MSGGGNVARRNCLWSPRHPDKAGIQPGIVVEMVGNVVSEPAYLSREDKDFRLRPDSPCFSFSTGSRRTGPR